MKCTCGHSKGYHWHGCNLASCAIPGCKCFKFVVQITSQITTKVQIVNK